MTEKKLRKAIEEIRRGSIINAGGREKPDDVFDANDIFNLCKEYALSVLPKDYRSNIDRSKRWEQGDFGYKIKWYGRGYNQAISEAKEKING